MEAPPSPFATYQAVSSPFMTPSPFASAGVFSSPFDFSYNAAPASLCSPFSSPSSFQYAGRVRSRDCFEAQQENRQLNTNVFSTEQQQMDEDQMVCSSPFKKRKPTMEVELCKGEGYGEPNTSTREKRKRGFGSEEMDTTKPPKVDRTTKQRKFLHKKPDTKDIPKARMIHVRFGPDLHETVEGKIVCKEPWGVQVQLLEGREDLGAEKGKRYWAKFSGHVHPVTNVPIMDAVHAC